MGIRDRTGRRGSCGCDDGLGGCDGGLGGCDGGLGGCKAGARAGIVAFRPGIATHAVRERDSSLPAYPPPHPHLPFEPATVSAPHPFAVYL